MIAVILFYETNGLINKVLEAVGLDPIAWQSDGWPARISVMTLSVWLRVGFNMIIYLAGLQGISARAVRSGQDRRRNARGSTFRCITVPLVGPSSFFLLIMNVIASFQVFDLIFVMTGGGPATPPRSSSRTPTAMASRSASPATARPSASSSSSSRSSSPSSNGRPAVPATSEGSVHGVPRLCRPLWPLLGSRLVARTEHMVDA